MVVVELVVLGIPPFLIILIVRIGYRCTFMIGGGIWMILRVGPILFLLFQKIPLKLLILLE